MEAALQKSVLAEAYRRSFWLFFMDAFGARQHCRETQHDDWVDPHIHRPLCDWLQFHIEDWERSRALRLRRPKKLAVIIFRGGGKSTIGCALDLWIQVRNPDLAEVISSYDIGKSKEFLGVNKAYMEGKAQFGQFSELYGDWVPEDPETPWQSLQLTHNRRTNRALRDYSFKTTSVSKGITGARPDVFRGDDFVVKEKLKEDNKWIQLACDHLDAAEFAVKTNGLWILQFTPYVDGDIATKVLLDEGVNSWADAGMRLPPRQFKKGGPWDVFYLPIRDEAGRSVLPKVYPEERLQEMEAKDPDDFAAQMLCTPAKGSHMPLNEGDIDNLLVYPEHVPNNLEYSIHCDTAFKTQKTRDKGDYNVIQVWGHDRHTGKVYFIDGRRNRTWGAKEFVDELLNVCKGLKYKQQYPFVITDDRVLGGKEDTFEVFLFDAFKRVNLPFPWYLSITRQHTRTDAAVRKVVYAWKSGLVRLTRGASELDSLIYEMTHIGFSRHDDMQSAASDVFHPDVYRPAFPDREDARYGERPYDQLLWARPGSLSDGEIRLMYDHDEEPELVDAAEMWKEFE